MGEPTVTGWCEGAGPVRGARTCDVLRRTVRRGLLAGGFCLAGWAALLACDAGSAAAATPAHPLVRSAALVSGLGAGLDGAPAPTARVVAGSAERSNARPGSLDHEQNSVPTHRTLPAAALTRTAAAVLHSDALRPAGQARRGAGSPAAGPRAGSPVTALSDAEGMVQRLTTRVRPALAETTVRLTPMASRVAPFRDRVLRADEPLRPGSEPADQAGAGTIAPAPVASPPDAGETTGTDVDAPASRPLWMVHPRLDSTDATQADPGTSPGRTHPRLPDVGRRTTHGGTALRRPAGPDGVPATPVGGDLPGGAGLPLSPSSMTSAGAGSGAALAHAGPVDLTPGLAAGRVPRPTGDRVRRGDANEPSVSPD